MSGCSGLAYSLSPPAQACSANVLSAMTFCLTVMGSSPVTVYDAFDFPYNKKFIDISVSTPADVNAYFCGSGFENYGNLNNARLQFQCSGGDYDGIYQLFSGFLDVRNKLCSGSISTTDFISSTQCTFQHNLPGLNPNYTANDMDNSYCIAYNESLTAFNEDVGTTCDAQQASVLSSVKITKDLSFVQYITNNCYIPTTTMIPVPTTTFETVEPTTAPGSTVQDAAVMTVETTISAVETTTAPWTTVQAPKVVKHRCRKRLYRYRHPRKCTWKHSMLF